VEQDLAVLARQKASVSKKYSNYLSYLIFKS
jgi:hypothetical protein